MGISNELQQARANTLRNATELNKTGALTNAQFERMTDGTVTPRDLDDAKYLIDLNSMIGNDTTDTRFSDADRAKYLDNAKIGGELVGALKDQLKAQNIFATISETISDLRK